MSRIGSVLCLAALLTACGKSDTDQGKPAPRRESGPKPCEKCSAPAGAGHRCGRTRYCMGCGRDAAGSHVCGVTVLCASCGREAGRDHLCGETRICRRRPCSEGGKVIEGGPGHVCGKTRFCRTCRLDGDIRDHRCNLQSYFCPRCEVEAREEPHRCGLSRLCTSCGREGALEKGKHACFRTAFCRTCRKEAALGHQH